MNWSEYVNTAQELVKLLKYEHVRSTAPVIAHHIARQNCQLPNGAILLPVTVPTATSRNRGRSYDQAQLLAKELSSTIKNVYFPLLARIGRTRQTETKRTERLK